MSYACAAASFDPTPSVVLCDSGAPSGGAYCTDEQWQQVLNTIGVTMDELAGRYSLALRLGSVAELGDGSRYDFGPGSSNPARYHTDHVGWAGRGQEVPRHAGGERRHERHHQRSLWADD